MVKVKASYKDLRGIFNELGVVYKSKNIVDKDKTIIFDLTGDDVVLYAFATGASARRVVDKGVLEVIKEGIYNPRYFQVPLVALDNFLNVFSNGRGVPLDIEIEVESEHDLSVILTEELELNGTKEVNTSLAKFNTYPVYEKVLKNVELLNVVDKLDFSVVGEVQRKEISTMISDLLPYLPEKLNDVAKNRVAVSFFNDYVQCNDAIRVVRYDNKFKGIFDNGGLSVHALGVIDGIFKLTDDIMYVQDVVNKVLVFKTSKLLISVVFDLEPRAYPRDFFALVKDDNYVEVSRVDLVEVLTRMGALEKSVDLGKVLIGTDSTYKVATFSTDSYAQPVKVVSLNSNDVEGLQGGLCNFEVPVNLGHLQGMLLSKTGVHSDNIRFTVQPDVAGKYFFRADDSSGVWTILIMIQRG